MKSNFNQLSKYVLEKDFHSDMDTIVNDVFVGVCSTMGPNGSYSIVNDGFAPYFTKDGVTVANKLGYRDPVLQSICRTLIEPSIESDKEIGDGTTTSIFFTSIFYKLFNDVFRNYVEMNEIKRKVDDIILYVHNKTINIGDVNSDLLYKTGLTTSNGDREITSNVIGLFNKCSPYSIDNVKVEHGVDTDVINVQNDIIFPGMKTLGMFSGKDVELTQYKCLVIGQNINKFDDNYYEYIGNVKSILECIYKDDKSIKALLMIGSSFDDDFVNVIDSINTQGQQYYPKIILATVPSSGSLAKEILYDINMILNGGYVPDLSNVSVDTLFKNKNVSPVVRVGSSKCYCKLSDLTEEHISGIRCHTNALKDKYINYPRKLKYGYHGVILRRRICMLIGEVITISVGGETPSDIEERKARYIDVLGSVKHAMIDGIIPGVGSVLVDYYKDVVSKWSDDDKYKLAFTKLCLAQYHYLTSGSVIGEYGTPVTPRILLDRSIPLEEYVFTNLSNNVSSTNVTDLDVYDVSKSLIFALRKGLSTAINLSKTTTIITG